MKSNNNNSVQDICASEPEVDLGPTKPARPSIHLAAVYECQDPHQAAGILSADVDGYIYQRDGHPNADILGKKCQQLHQADWAAITSSGMSAMALALLSQLTAGDHVLISSRLYGRTTSLFQEEAKRLGMTSEIVDMLLLDSVRAAINSKTTLVVTETISNPQLRICDISALSQIAHESSALLLVDNTFASPIVCQPLTLGADLVLESLTKVMNGHSDVTLGLLCGKLGTNDRIASTSSTWGLLGAPFDCWLADRGLSTLYVRMRTACQNAAEIAKCLAQNSKIERVIYPGFESHPDFELANRQFLPAAQSDLQPLFGSMLTFQLPDQSSVSQFIGKVREKVRFFPSLGDICTSLSHPASTSHRGLSDQQMINLDIWPETVRLSVGIDSPAAVIESISAVLNGLDE